MRNKILLIEDDLGLAIPLKDFFEENGLKVNHSTNGEEGLELYKLEQPNLIILDIILPSINGFDVLYQIRNTNLTIPIILITGTEFSSEKQIRGYQLGAINFMQKPILPQAVLSLIKNILSFPMNIKNFNLNGHKVVVQDQVVQIDDEKYNVREKDAILLVCLLERKNQLVHRSNLLKQIWQDDHPEKNNLLDGAILRIRRLFKNCHSVTIKTIYGYGYMLEVLY